MKNAGWDFGTSGSQSTGTVRNAVRPPQFRERKLEVLYNQATPGAQGLSVSRNAPEDSFDKDARDQETNHEDVSQSDPLSYITRLHLPVTFELKN